MTTTIFFIALTVLQPQYARIYACVFTDNYMDNITISVAWDSWGTSGTYFVSGCHGLEPYFENTNHSLYVYWNDEASWWLIGNRLGNYSDWKAMCTTELLSDCSFFQWIIYEPIEIDWDAVNYKDKILMFALPFSIVVWFIANYYVLWIGYQGALNDPNPNMFNKGNINKDAVELQATNNDKSNTSHSIQTELTEEISDNSWKTKVKFIGKFIFHFVFKPGLEVYDFYTDVILALLWLNGFYGLRTANTCLIKLEVYAYTLLISSSIGFLIGVIGHIYFLFVTYNCAAIKQQQSTLSIANQARVGYFTFGKALIEDTMSIILLLTVAINEVGIVTDIEWWLAYYSSCAAFAVSSIIFIRSEMTNKCPTIEHLKNHKVCQTLFYFLFVFWCMVPGTAPLYPIAMYQSPTGADEGYAHLQLGFCVNNNDCQRKTYYGDKEYNKEGGLWFEEFNFNVDVDDNYGIYCLEGYDHIVGQMEYLDGMRCYLFDRSTNEKVCNFWMYSNDCWNGPCPPYSSNMTACFGWIGF